MRFFIKIGSKEYPVEIEDKGNKVLVKIGEKEFSFKVHETPRASKSFFPEKKQLIEVLAPISGTISEIFVKEGELVKKGEKLLSLLAMKMENEICAEKEGKVKKIFVKKGQNVSKGEKLLEIE